MNPSNSIKNILYSTIHRNKKPVQMIADETGISSNYLYRAGLPLDESGVKFPVDYMIPLMKSTGNYKLLEYIANLCGFLLVKMPIGNAWKKDEIDLVDKYQDDTIAGLKGLKEFFKAPTKDNYEKALELLNNVMTTSAGAKKFVNKVHKGDLELELWNE